MKLEFGRNSALGDTQGEFSHPNSGALADIVALRLWAKCRRDRQHDKE